MSERILTVDELFGQRLQALREAAGLTQQQLADRVATLGGSMHQTTIMRTERGTRHATLNEYLLLAAALDVPPPLLLLPIGEADAVQITVQSVIHPHLALRWLSGQDVLATSDRGAAGDWKAWRRNRLPLDLYDEHDRISEQISEARSDVTRARAVGDPEAEREASHRYWKAIERLHGHIQRMHEAGVRPPAQNQLRVRDMERLGLDTSRVRAMTDEEMEAARTVGSRKLDWPEPVELQES